MLGRIRNTVRRFLANESASANTEYVIVMALIIVAVIAIVAQVGPRVIARWNVVEDKLDGKTPTPAAGAH